MAVQVSLGRNAFFNAPLYYNAKMPIAMKALPYAVSAVIDLIRSMQGKIRKCVILDARTLISLNERGFIKVVVLRESRRIIGAQLLCEHAGELIAELLLAVRTGLTVDELLLSVRPHPSYCEAVTQALENARDKLHEC